tara:strand:- start:6615 stop:6779 length:165 start_codon:yes stop_codon:yes gene_type:complete
MGKILIYKTDMSESKKQILRTCISKWVKDKKILSINSDKLELIVKNICAKSGLN